MFSFALRQTVSIQAAILLQAVAPGNGKEAVRAIHKRLDIDSAPAILQALHSKGFTAVFRCWSSESRRFWRCRRRKKDSYPHCPADPESLDNGRVEPDSGPGGQLARRPAGKTRTSHRREHAIVRLNALGARGAYFHFSIKRSMMHSAKPRRRRSVISNEVRNFDSLRAFPLRDFSSLCSSKCLFNGIRRASLLQWKWHDKTAGTDDPCRLFALA